MSDEKGNRERERDVVKGKKLGTNEKRWEKKGRKLQEKAEKKEKE